MVIGLGRHLTHTELAALAEGIVEQSELVPDRSRHLRRCLHCLAMLRGHREAVALLRLGGTDQGLPIPVELPRSRAPVIATGAAALAIAVLVGAWIVVPRGAAPTPSPVHTATSALTAGPTSTPRPTPTPTPTPRPTMRIYRVQRGDTLKSIAAKFAISYSLLLLANPQIGSADLIKPGQLINIPWPGWSP